MHSLLHLEVIRSEHPGDAEPRHWKANHPPLGPPPRTRRLRVGAAERLAGLAARLDDEGARRAVAR
jgi:hypothetical protein